jgi:hypothetical protein
MRRVRFDFLGWRNAFHDKKRGGKIIKSGKWRESRRSVENGVR